LAVPDDQLPISAHNLAFSLPVRRNVMPPPLPPPTLPPSAAGDMPTIGG